MTSRHAHDSARPSPNRLWRVVSDVWSIYWAPVRGLLPAARREENFAYAAALALRDVAGGLINLGPDAFKSDGVWKQVQAAAAIGELLWATHPEDLLQDRLVPKLRLLRLVSGDRTVEQCLDLLASLGLDDALLQHRIDGLLQKMGAQHAMYLLADLIRNVQAEMPHSKAAS